MRIGAVRLRVVAWLVVLVVAAGLAGYLIGHHPSLTVTVTGPGIAIGSAGGGTAYIGAREALNRQPYGFAYSVPQFLQWSDSSGGLHAGSPPCLPIGRGVRLRNIEAVQFTMPSSVTTGTVVWVQC